MNLSITNEQISDMPLITFEGKIHLIETEEATLAAVKKLKKEKYLGFDTETRPVFKKGVSYPVALLQLSTDNNAYLFRINKTPLSLEILSILSDKNIKKAGVAIHDDIVALQKILDFTPAAFVEIAEVAKQRGFKKLGLRNLCAAILDKRMSKKAKLSNWEANVFTEAQLKYAATDAWIGLLLYHAFASSNKSK